MLIPDLGRERQLSISVSLEDVRAEILLDYLNETHQGIRESSYKAHTHSVEELYFTQSGWLTLELAGKELVLHEGDLLLIAPGTVHRVAACSDDVRRFNLRFTLHMPENARQDERMPWILHRPKEAERAELAFVSDILRHAPENMGTLEFCRVKAYYAILMSRALELLMPQHSDTIPQRQNHLVLCVRIDDFFFDRIHEQVTLSDLAKELSYSSAQTSRLLREYYGMGFTEKLSRARFERAEQMLAAGASRKEVAAACGYTTRQGFDAFLRRFKSEK